MTIAVARTIRTMPRVMTTALFAPVAAAVCASASAKERRFESIFIPPKVYPGSLTRGMIDSMDYSTTHFQKMQEYF